MYVRFNWGGSLLLALAALSLRATTLHAQGYSASPPDSSAPDSTKLSLESLADTVIPASVSEGLYLKFWAWGSYLNVSHGDPRSNGDGQLSLDVTKSFQGRFAVTVEMSLQAANDHWRGDLEQAFVSLLPIEGNQTIITIGKFNASVGAEGRDFWNRFNGTTSLLFNAEPQDFIGGMVSVPLGESNVTLKPFLITDFDGDASLHGGPSGGVTLQYQPNSTLTISLTGLAGPGFSLDQNNDGDDPYYSSGSHDYGGYGGYGGYSGTTYYANDYGSASPIENWRGPSLYGERTGTLVFINGTIIWKPRNDLTLAGQALLGTTRSAEGNSGWQGCLILANFDITDQWRIFGRWSFINDSGVITGTAQRRHELSAGISYSFNSNIEVRGEYRHDFSNTLGDIDSLSLHLSVGF